MSSPLEESRLGRYRLCFQLASGGMATVFLARAEGPAGFEKLVALKRVRASLAEEPGFITMFLDEARIASQISHANVCTVFDFGEVEGSYYIAMEFLFGVPLSQFAKALRRVSDPELLRVYPWLVARLIADACEGLHAAHELRDANNEPLQVVHRDISPQNIIVTYDGIAKIVDFGVASARNRLHHTVSGQLKGKHSYMAPEQLGGGGIDRRVDVWAMGVVLWELLAGRRLFKARSESETLFRVIDAEIVPPSKVNPGCPPALDSVVLRALRRDPAERYPTARELGRELSRVLAEQGAIGLAEVAEWMGAVFAEERARTKQLCDLARKLPDQTEPIDVEVELESETIPQAMSLPPAPAPRSKGRSIVIALVALLTLVAGAGAWYASSAETPPARSASPDPQRPTLTETAPPAPEVREPPAVDAGPPDAGREEPTEAPAEEESREVQRPARPGHVSIVTQPGWAEVYRGSSLLGQTPVRLTLPGGRHVLRFRLYGRGEPQRRVIRVVPGRTVRRVVHLEE